MRKQRLLAPMLCLVVAACNDEGGSRADYARTYTAARGAHPASYGGSAGTPDSTPAAGAAFWSCGTAASVCSCVRVDSDLGAQAGSCPASNCCFEQGSTGCSCRLSGAPLDCAALKSALSATRAAASCPNPARN